MSTVISGDSGVSKVQDGVIGTTKLADAAITPPKMNGQQTGNPPVFGVRAWCQFDGTLAGTNAPAAGGNVTSVTRNGTGDYTITLTTAMPDTNYAVACIARPQAGSNIFAHEAEAAAFVRTTTTFRIILRNTGASVQDSGVVSVTVTR